MNCHQCEATIENESGDSCPECGAKIVPPSAVVPGAVRWTGCCLLGVIFVVAMTLFHQLFKNDASRMFDYGIGAYVIFQLATPPFALVWVLVTRYMYGLLWKHWLGVLGDVLLAILINYVIGFVLFAVIYNTILI
jgi:hypothetical protein